MALVAAVFKHGPHRDGRIDQERAARIRTHDGEGLSPRRLGDLLLLAFVDAAGLFIDELCFSLPGRVMQCFFSLLRNAGSWLGASPVDLRASNVSPYASSFAFDGFDPIRIWGMNELICEPACSEMGFFARHLYVLFEDVANLLAEKGIRMTLDGFTWDNNMIRPFRKNQLYASGPQQGVV